MSRNRILFVLEEGRYGGPQVYIINLISELKQAFDCHFLVPEKNSEKTLRESKKNNINIHLIRMTTLSIKLNQIFLYIIFFFPDILRIFRKIKKIDAEIVYVGGGSWQFKSIFAAWLAQKKIVWHLNDTNMHFLVLACFKLFSRFAKFYVFASQCTQTYYEDLIFKKSIYAVIPSSFSINFSEEIFEKKNIKGQLKVVTVANINPVKGFERLVNIARAAHSQQLRVHFYIVGEIFASQSQYANSIMSGIKSEGLDNITFLGGRDNIKCVLDTMDLYLCTSLFESSPIAVWEAMARGLPVLSTKVGDVKKYLEFYGAGRIFDDEHSATMWLLDISSDSEKYLRCRKAARRCSVENFSPKACANEHIKLFNRVI